MTNKPEIDKNAEQSTDSRKEKKLDNKTKKEIGGPKRPEPTRYGDWERKGQCIDF